MALKKVGNFVARGANRVDQQLVAIIEEAARRANMEVEAYSGFRPGSKGFHGKGRAADVRIMQNGRPLPNYQTPETFEIYERLAHAARQVQMEMFPELRDRFRWGGYFSGPKGKYGAMDLMHFDLGGGNGLGMAGGSWETGLNAQQRRLFPGARSRGISGMAMGQGGQPQNEMPQGPNLSPEALDFARSNPQPGGFGQDVTKVADPTASMPNSPVFEKPASPFGEVFQALGANMKAPAPQQQVEEPSFGTGDPMGGPMAAMQGASNAKGLLDALMPNIEQMLSLGKRRPVAA